MEHRRRRFSLLALIFCWAALLASPIELTAATTAAKTTLPAGKVTTNPAVRSFIASMHKRHHFDEATLTRLFNQVTLRPDIIDRITHPAEKLPWYRYRKIFLTEKRIKAGLQFWQAHADTLQRAAQEYGVPPEIIVAIIGVETFYGRHSGRYPVLDALTTLAFHYPPRARFFRRELENFLLLTRKEKLNPQTVLGSYAGAMGTPQFIPSSYQHYAVDFTADGSRDLIGSTADAIGSVANYLKQHGWLPQTGIVFPATVTGLRYKTLDTKKLGLTKTVADLKTFGVTTTAPLRDDAAARLIALRARKKQQAYWLGLHNFYVITRYNHSTNYAMAIVQLSQAITKRLPQTLTTARQDARAVAKPAS